MESSLRVAVLYAELSGHIAACLRALVERTHARLLVVRWPARKEAPFEDSFFSWIDILYDKPDHTPGELFASIEQFEPHVVLMSGWMDGDYLRISRKLRKRNVLVIGMIDNQWLGSFKQRAARLIAPWYLHSGIDMLWVPGARQKRFAGKLGYTGEKCLHGLLTCDWERFAAARSANGPNPVGDFLYVGRYVEAKGLDILVEGYAAYRRQVPDPVKLMCAGAGPEDRLLRDREGIEDLGFLQPDGLPGLMARAGAFILPSRHEPWGVVLHEAAATGLPIVASSACGSGDHLVETGRNGFVFDSESASGLAEALIRLHRLSPEERAQMGQHSFELSQQFTPAAWVDVLLEAVEQHLETSPVTRT
jgi:glycosyltransferase involved in cell wall biosynthesis